MKFFARIVSILNLLAMVFILIAISMVEFVFPTLSLPAFPSFISKKDIYILLSSFSFSFFQLLYLHFIIENFNKQKNEIFSNNILTNIFLILVIILNIYLFNAVYLSTDITLKAFKYSIKIPNIFFLTYGFYLLEQIFYLFIITINIVFIFLTLFKKYFSNNFKKALGVSFLLMTTIIFCFFQFKYYKDYQYHKNFPSSEEIILTDYKNKEIELNYSEKLILVPPPGYIRVKFHSIKLNTRLNQDVSRKQIVAIYAKNEKQYKKIIENYENDFLFCTYDCSDGLIVIYKSSDIKKHYYSFDETVAKYLKVDANENDIKQNRFYSETLFYEIITHYNYSHEPSSKIIGTTLTMTGEVLLLNQKYTIVNYFSSKNKYTGDYQKYHDFNKHWMDILTTINPSVESNGNDEFQYLFELAPNTSDNYKKIKTLK